jgi:thiamine-phosphate pyrophosphorylase
MTSRRSLDLSLHLVIDPELCGHRSIDSVVADAVDGGVRTVQLRDTAADAASLLHQLEQLATVIGGRSALLVHGRADVAIAARARGIAVDGVHLAQGDTSPTDARELLGDDAIIGLTANTEQHVAELRRMPRRDVDYLSVGAIRHHTTTRNRHHVLGVRGFASFAAEAELPCVAMGGITLADVRALREAGAAGIALDSAVCAASDPRAVAAEFAAAWRER